MIGTRYQVVRLLGQGGMSNIYLCDDLNLKGRRWVVKEMVARYTDPQEQQMAVKLFEREAHLLSSLDHRNLPKVNDFFIYQGRSYLVMEFVDGEDLGRMLTRIKTFLPERQVAEIGEQMATVLYYLHCHKPHPIIFRDVKPSNIMITGNLVKLIDFGIARHFNPNSKKGDTMRIGSPGYAPPEQYNGQTDPRSDVYALGVTLHHAITGRDPTMTQTPFILPPVRDLNPGVTEEMVRIIERSTQLDPDQRYQTMIEMKRDLQNLARALQGGTRVVRSADATAPVTAVPAAQAVAAARAALSGQPVAASPGPTPAAPAPPPAPAPAAPAAPRKKANLGGLLRWLFILALLGGLWSLARFHPEVLQDGRQAVQTWLQRVLPQKPPTEPLESARRIYDQGGNLVQADEYLRLALSSQPDDPLARIYRSNVLALSVPQPTVPARIGVAYPAASAPTCLAALAAAQELLNRRGGAAGKPVVLIVAAYGPGKLESCLDGMASGLYSRKENQRGGGIPPEAILIYATGPVDAPKSPLPLFFAQPSGVDPTREFPADRPWPVGEIRSLAGERKVLSATLALSEQLKPFGLDAPEIAGSSDRALVLAGPDDLPGLPIQHGSLLLLTEREDQLPPAAEHIGARALVRFSALQPNEIAGEVAGLKTELAVALAIDALLWVARSHYKLHGLEGATLSWNKADQPVPNGWTLYRATEAGWRVERTLEGTAP